MDSQQLVQLLVIGLVALAVGLFAYVVIFPFLSGEHKTEKRLETVAAGRSSRNLRANASADDLQTRRKQVQENLKELEKKQKAKNKVTLRTRLLRAGLDVTNRQFYIASAISGVVGAVASVIGGLELYVAGLIGFACAFGLPRWFVAFLGKRRQAKFLNEFANAIDVIVRGVKTGLPLNECLDIIARESPEPIRSEFAELIEQQRVGVPLMECFDRMLDRMPVPEVNFFAIVISIQQSAGGNLSEALSNLSGVLRARKMLAAKVKALSAEAKASAAILGALPFVVMSMVYITSPDYISLLWTRQQGQIMLAFAGFWMFCGLFIMRQMINFKY
ncbi:MAG: type II secretion system F family protein [Hyphomicrobiaceae bacterium]